MSPTFGVEYILPTLPEFMRKYPRIRPEWMFENRQVDLIAEGYDAAIGGGLDLTPGIISKTLAPAHIIAVASPEYMQDRVPPNDPSGLVELDGIVMRSMRTGRIRQWQMQSVSGEEQPALLTERIVVNDPAAMRRAAILGLGVAMIAKPDALLYLENGELIRLLPAWYADAGPISIYYTNRALLPAKTRVFIDFIAEASQRERWPERLAGTLG